MLYLNSNSLTLTKCTFKGEIPLCLKPIFLFYVVKGGERYVSRSYVLKDDDTFIIFTSFLDACIMC